MIHSLFAPGPIRSLERIGQFAPWNFRSLALSLPGLLAPWNFRSPERIGPGTFAPWNFRTREYSLPGTFALWNGRSLILHRPHRPTGHTGAGGRDLILHQQPVMYQITLFTHHCVISSAAGGAQAHVRRCLAT